MASKRLRDTGTHLDGRVVDYGASYFTARDPAFVRLVDRMMAEGVVEPWTDSFHVAGSEGITGIRIGPMRYRAPRGLRTVIELLAGTVQEDGVVIRTECDVTDVAASGDAVIVDGDEFDVVGICMPGPQAARLVSASMAPEHLHSLTWEPVIAVTLVYAERTWMDFDGVFVNDDPVLTWIADDGRRRGDDAPVLVAHVHPVLSARHLADPTEVIAVAVASVRRILGLADLPAWADAHRWTFAKPLSAHEVDHVVVADGRVGFGGDAFAGGPRVETAWISGRSLGVSLGDALA